MLSLTALRDYQKRAIAFVLARSASGLIMDMGLGKTIIVLTAIVEWTKRGTAKRFLVIGPLRVIETVWRQEAKKWGHTAGLRIALVRGSPKLRGSILRQHADIYLVNPENTQWLIHWMKTNGCPFDGLVVDESSMYKSSSTQRWKALRLALSMFKVRVILTGTPTPNTLLEIWSQLYLLDMGERLGTAFYRFRDRFFESDYMGYKYEARPNAAEYVYEQLQDVVMRLDAKDWMTLPPVLRNRVPVRLPEDVAVKYKVFEKEMFVELERGLVAFNAAALSMRCHQLANGAVYELDEDGARLPGEPWKELHDVKIEAVKEIVASTGSPVIIGYQFKHDLARLQQAFPSAPHFHAGNSDALRIAFSQGNVPVLLCNPKSAGHGMNDMEKGGHTIIFFSLTWSREAHDQLIARISGARAVIRGTPTVVHYVVAEETVDEAIMISNRDKGKGQQSLLNALREYQGGYSDILS